MLNKNKGSNEDGTANQDLNTNEGIGNRDDGDDWLGKTLEAWQG